MWAGVIGDDGMAGINIAQGDATGEAHLALQSYALALRERGVVLAVSSKNTDEIARQVFREHPDMLLREEHIAVFQANWNDKASNLEAIAKALNICLDALVFVDDNPAERALVRQRLPQVAVPELPERSGILCQNHSRRGLFQAVGFADEDRKRAQFYSDNAKRVALQANIGSIDDYLRSLEMRISFAAFDESGRARIAQLINKSNQFNLTTRRYSETDVDALISDPAVFTMQIRLEDVFGDNGMISTIICRLAGEDWLIDTWLMSCRVN
ncbi:MAG: HAD-IIIC family phosphatase [Sphingomonadales bacterium]|nr:HAD-IIIC family phosphatase [Sphingomonadales bacterium]